MRRALVVRGGWDGHEPVACTDSFLPFLRGREFEVEVSDDLAVYEDGELLATNDLVVQCWSMGRLTEPQAAGLSAAVQTGTGFAGWHGGVVAAFDAEPYLHLIGGRFVYHPPGLVDHELTVVPGRQHHPIMAGVDTVPLHTEKYWVLTDELCDVLATVRFRPDELPASGLSTSRSPGNGAAGAVTTPWRREVTVPAVWTRQWGAGRVFVSTVGHTLTDLEQPLVRQLTERGLLWAARE